MKKYSINFWLFFWLVAAVFLSSWYFYWNTKNKGFANTISQVVNFLPINALEKKEYNALANIADYMFHSGNQTRTFLVLFQNNLELRPGGGFIGSFGIVKIRGGKIISLETHDLSNFDARIPATIEPPYPLKQTLHVNSWKMRDSNFSPDFAIDAKQAENFYNLGDGQEKFDGVIGITSDVLTSILQVTGPVQVDGYPGTYDSKNAIVSLEYQVEKAYADQGIDKVERKSVMGLLAKEIAKKVFELSTTQKVQLAKVLLRDLQEKDIQLQFNDALLQKMTEDANWAGKVNLNWNKDYLMISDANLGAFKSDYFIKRSLKYTIDFSGDVPRVKLLITYQHTATQKDWMTKDYLSYLRVYVPQNAILKATQNFDNYTVGTEFNKQYFGALINVPLGETKTVELDYDLPSAISQEYNLLVQKQAGVNNVPLEINIISKDGEREYRYFMSSDIYLN